MCAKVDSPPINIKPFGRHAVLIEWPHKVTEHILEHILQFELSLKQNHLVEEGWETVPAYNSLLLLNTTIKIDFSSFSHKIQDWYTETREPLKTQKYLWHLPVSYDLEFGIDLEEIAEKLNKTIPEIITLHSTPVYTVYGIGFLPGFMYLGGLPKVLEIPRKTSPRLRVAKGAVGLAGLQTGIYPQESPGGWNIIGNCSVPMFNAQKKEPCFVKVGDKIKFHPISRAEYDLHKIEAEVGIYIPEKTEINA